MSKRPISSQRIAYTMRALGKDDLPAEISCAGTTWRNTHTAKHDFFAATGFYESPDGRRAVLKMGRTVDFAGVPLDWLGRWLCRREMRFYTALADLPNIPKILGTIGKTGFVHEFVEGKPLSKDRPIPSGFFTELRELMNELHRRRIAYVDANKPENILQGDDNRPHLIDFQISWDLHELGNTFINRWWLRHLQREDLYHVLKHWKRLKPEEMSPEDSKAADKISPLIKLHRFVTKPYFALRRRTFARLRATGRLLPEGSK